MPEILKSYETGADSVDAIGDDGGTEYDIAQSFQLDADGRVGSVAINCRKVNTISDPITLRIETNGASIPSGTLAHASATATATPTNTSHDWVIFTFPSGFQLPGSTKYWIVCSTPDQSVNNKYEWQRDTSSGYGDGGQSVSVNGGAWSAESATTDMYFRIYEAISGKALFYQQL